MAHELPPLKSLRVFDACIRTGNFTRAAAELNVGQPAISHQIQTLERDLGIRLFERRGVQTFPTQEALAYHRVISAAMTDIARATTALRRAAAQPGLTLATYPGIAMFWLMPKLAALRQADPSLRVRVTTAERDRDVQVDEVDCAILFGDGHWPGYESRLLMREAVIPVAAPSVAARIDGRDFAEILEYGPLIHLEDSDRRWFNWRDWRDERAPKAGKIDPGMQVTNHGIAIHQTLIGQGISLGWYGVIDDLIRNRLLVPIDTEPLRSERGYHMVASNEFLNSRFGRSVLEALLVNDNMSDLPKNTAAP